MNIDISGFKAWATEQLGKTDFSDQDKAEILEQSNSIFELADRQKSDGTEGADGVLNKQELANAQNLFKSAIEFIKLFSQDKKTEETKTENPFEKLSGYNLQKHPAKANQATITINGESVGVLKNGDGSFTILRGDGGCPTNKLETQQFASIEDLTNALKDPELKFGKFSGLNLDDYDW